MKLLQRPLAAILSILVCALMTTAQEPQSPDVVKVFTELVRTDVTVFDQNGRFVTGLKQNDFEIKIDGKPREIQSVDQVIAGTPRDLSAFSDKRSPIPPVTDTTALSDAAETNRTVLFFVDDFHMDLPGFSLLRKTLADFIDKEMNYNTEAAIVSASSSIGFLQQLTNDKDVLREAVKRITLKHLKAEDLTQPRMREIDAVVISQGDREVFDYFVDATMRLSPGMTRDTAANQVTERVTTLLELSTDITKRTLASLEQLIVTAGKAPGRKLLILTSDGFFLDHRNSDVAERAEHITGLAAKNGVVIYSMDSRGLVPPMSDPLAPIDRSHRLDRATNSEVWYSQQVMNLLARDTGGKTIFNTNDLSAGMHKALKETSIYYMLTWKPEPGTSERNKFRKISVSVIGRPDLTVHVRKGFYGGDGSPATASTKEKDKQPAGPPDPKAELRKALLEPFPDRRIPISIALNYVATPDNKVVLSTSIQIPRWAITFGGEEGGQQTGTLEVLGVIYDDKGHPGGQVDDRLTMKADASTTAEKSDNLVSTYPIKVGPGLYQVRVAVRDQRSGRVGNANAWANIPDLTTAQFALSSLILGDGKIATDRLQKQNRDPLAQVNLNVDRHYLRDSNLRLMVFAYNAKLSASNAQPDVAIQIEVLHNQQPVIRAPFKPISTKGIPDLKQLPYAADVPLAGLTRGHYELKVTVLDRVTSNSISRVAQFEID